MPTFINRKQRDFSVYDQMTDDQLCQILRSDAQQEGCEDTDMELVLHVMEVLAKRREERKEQKDAAKALETFKQNYADIDQADFELEYPNVSEKKKFSKRWKAGAIAAAAALVIVICGTVPVGASGDNIAKIVGKWTEDLFYFAPADTTTTAMGTTMPYAQLQELLAEHDLVLALPQWLPEGYEVCDARFNETSLKRMFHAAHICGDKLITLSIRDYVEESPAHAQQGGGLIELYERAGIQYYIFANNAHLHAAWIIEDFECHLSGPLTLEEMKKLIDSIEKG